MPKEPEYIQRWLTLDQIADTLRLPKSCVLNLAKKGVLGVIWGSNKNVLRSDTRFLDPTPEYQRRLRLGATLHQRIYPIPPHTSELALFTLREVAEIMGWTLKYARTYMDRHKPPHVQVSAQIYLYSSRTVRALLWERQSRTQANKRSHFLITELVEWFRKWYQDDLKGVPTDEEFLADDRVQRKLMKIVELNESDQFQAKADLAAKAKLARQVLQILESATTSVAKP